jgi:hypothetical protein
MNCMCWAACARPLSFASQLAVPSPLASVPATIACVSVSISTTRGQGFLSLRHLPDDLVERLERMRDAASANTRFFRASPKHAKET